MNRDSAHYLKPLKSTRTPKRLAFMDIQTQTKRKGKHTEYGWACGAMGTTCWTGKDKVREDVLKVYERPVDMWAALDAFCLPSKRVVVFTFDLPVQLRTSRALVHLPKLGWHLETVVLEPGAAWAMFKNGKRSLMFCDLKTWTPYDFERVKNAAMGHNPQMVLGRVGSDPIRTMAFNRAQIIREATLQILVWIDRDGLGPFKPTGSGQSYSAFRRKWLHDRILVHDDIQRLRAERVSMWAGRTEAWRHGQIEGGPFLELDMRAAYARIAAQCNVPTVAQGQVHKPTVERVLNDTTKHAFLSHITVQTEVPILPASSGQHTFWPAGTFSTWAWDPELALADTYATKVIVHKAYKYRTAPALKEFASYVLGTLDRPPDDQLGLPTLVMKHWSRTLVGRFGLRYRAWVPFSEDNDPDLSMCTFIDIDTNTMTDMLCVGKDMLLLGELTESVESVPQIPAWVMSECRRRLWETMVQIGLDKVVYVDTDSIIIATGGDRQFERETLHTLADLWAPKRRLINLQILGPRNLSADDTRRMSGLPLTAEQTGLLEYRGEIMRSIRESMRHGQLDTVSTVTRNFKFTATDIRRKHLPNGETEAFRIEPKTMIESEL